MIWGCDAQCTRWLVLVTAGGTLNCRSRRAGYGPSRAMSGTLSRPASLSVREDIRKQDRMSQEADCFIFFLPKRCSVGYLKKNCECNIPILNTVLMMEPYVLFF